MPSAEERRYRELFHPTGSFTHIVIGSSHTAWGLNPRLIESSKSHYFNFSMPGTGLEFHRDLYELYRRYNPRPKVVLYSADWFVFSTYGSKSLDEDSSYFPSSLLWERVLDEPRSAGRRLGNWFRLKRDVSFLQRRIGLFQYPTHVLEEAYYEGFTPVSSRTFNTNRSLEGLKSNLGRSHELVQFIQRLKRDKVTIVLLQLPEYLPIAGEHPGENALIARLAEEAHVPFLNFNTEYRSTLNNDKQYFVDFEHLNVAGSEVFGRRLKLELERLSLP